MAKASVLDRIRQLDEEKAKLMNDAKNEAMEAVRSALDNLNSLGFNYRITEVGSGGARKGTRQIDASKPCSICGFQTIPPHDARSHRTQDPKKAFSAKELADRGMTKA